MVTTGARQNDRKVFYFLFIELNLLGPGKGILCGSTECNKYASCSMVFAEQYQALCQEYTDILYLSGHFIPFRTFYTFQDILYLSAGQFIPFRTFYTFLQDILYLSGHFIYLNPFLFYPWAKTYINSKLF